MILWFRAGIYVLTDGEAGPTPRFKFAAPRASSYECSLALNR
jgi:hypothetical protein